MGAAKTVFLLVKEQFFFLLFRGICTTFSIFVSYLTTNFAILVNSETEYPEKKI